MLKRLLTLAAVAALTAGSVPAGDACGPAPAAEHSCCSMQATALADSCCGSVSSTSTPVSSDEMRSCDCAHPAATPAVFAAESMPRPDGPVAAVVAALSAAQDRSTRSARSVIRACARPHRPPPAYLLDCAFLT